MKRKFIWVVVSGLVVVSLLLAACAPAPAKETAPATPATPAAPAKPATPAAPATPAVKEASPAVPETMVKFTLTKLDGTVVEKLMEKPKYGGTFILSMASVILAWDEAYQAPWTLAYSLAPTSEDLMEGDWKRGPTGTGEFSWGWSENFGPKSWTGLLAESYEMPDSITAIFHIRQGVHWALNPASEASRLVNGREFTADDAVFNIKRIYIDTPTSTMYGMLGESRPTEVYAKDKYTVVMKVAPGQMAPAFHDVSQLTKMVPPEVVKKYGDMNKWENVVGTGAFMLVDYVPMSSATWIKNPNYYLKDPIFPQNQLPYLDRVKELIIPDLSTRLAALRTGKVELDTGVYKREEVLPLLKDSPNLKSRRMPPSGCAMFGFRMDKPELPFQDIRVRKALIMAVNNQEIVDTYYGGDASPLTYKIPPIPEYIANGWYTPVEQLPPEIKEIYTYNPVKAKQLLTEAGYPNGFKTEVVFNVASADYADIALMVKEYWVKNLGVDLKLDIKETAVATSLYQRKTFNQMLYWGRAGNQQLMYTVRKGNMYNWAMVDDPKVEQYYQKISADYFDTPKLDKLMNEMNLYVLSQAWYWPAPRNFNYRLWQTWVKNYNGEMSAGVYSHFEIAKFISVDQELKKSMGY